MLVGLLPYNQYAERQNSYTPDQKPLTAKRNCDGHPALCAVILFGHRQLIHARADRERRPLAHSDRTKRQRLASHYLLGDATRIRDLLPE